MDQEYQLLVKGSDGPAMLQLMELAAKLGLQPTLVTVAVGHQPQKQGNPKTAGKASTGGSLTTLKQLCKPGQLSILKLLMERAPGKLTGPEIASALGITIQT